MPHAFKQAPWRLQLRSTSRLAMWVVGLLVLGGLYLAVNSKVARAGRALLVLERQHEQLAQTNAELSAQYASLTTPELMLERAAYLGFRPARPEEVEFVVVEDLPAPEDFEPPRPPASSRADSGMLSPSYTETLGDWLSRTAQGVLP